jgi:hypothetical protein
LISYSLKEASIPAGAPLLPLISRYRILTTCPGRFNTKIVSGTPAVFDPSECLYSRQLSVFPVKEELTERDAGKRHPQIRQVCHLTDYVERGYWNIELRGENSDF